MLLLLKAIVTFTPSSRNASSSGEGRKSGITLRSPNGSSVYFIFALINCPALSPVAGAQYANDTAREVHLETTSPIAATPLFRRRLNPLVSLPIPLPSILERVTRLHVPVCTEKRTHRKKLGELYKDLIRNLHTYQPLDGGLRL